MLRSSEEWGPDQNHETKTGKKREDEVRKGKTTHARTQNFPLKISISSIMAKNKYI